MNNGVAMNYALSLRGMEEGSRVGWGDKKHQDLPIEGKIR
jgi:hypothetical protein